MHYELSFIMSLSSKSKYGKIMFQQIWCTFCYQVCFFRNVLCDDFLNKLIITIIPHRCHQLFILWVNQPTVTKWNFQQIKDDAFRCVLKVCNSEVYYFTNCITNYLKNEYLSPIKIQCYVMLLLIILLLLRAYITPRAIMIILCPFA